MDGPADALTNIHRIEGLASIQWTSYALEADQSFAGANSSSVEQFEALQAAELELRAQGYHVFLEVSKRVLFIFMMIGPTGSSMPSEESKVEGLGQIVDAYSLTMQRSGLINAKDSGDGFEKLHENFGLGKRKRSLDEKATGFQNQAAINHNSLLLHQNEYMDASEDLQDPISIYDLDSIRAKSMNALVASLVHLLMRCKSSLPLGSSSFIWPSPPDIIDVLSGQGVDLRPVSTEVQVHAIGTLWQRNGTLLIGCYRLARTWRLSSFEVAGAEVILAPFGWKGVALKLIVDDDNSLTEEQCKRRQSRDSSSRKASLTLLKRHGIEIQPGVGWISLQLSKSIPMITSNKVNTQWPANLCFTTSGSSIASMRNPIECFGTLASMQDPLADAEDWFMDESDRIQRIAEQLQVDDGSRGDKDSESSEDEEIPESLRMRSDDLLEPQILSGIYPTPPDGSKPQYLTPMMERMGVPAGKLDDSEATMQQSEPSDPILPIEIDLATYSHLEKDELFGDAEEQMYANNGITEDDFDFFDEPDEMPIATSSPKDSPMALKTSDKPEISMIFDDTVISSPPLLPTNEDGIGSEPKIDDAYENTTTQSNVSSPLLINSILTQDLTIKSHPSNMYEEPMNLRPTVTRYHMDDKYTKIGKFATLTSKHPLTANPSVAPSVKSAIPILHEHSVLKGSKHHSSPMFDSPYTDDSDETPLRNETPEKSSIIEPEKHSPAESVAEDTFQLNSDIFSTSLPSPPESIPMSSICPSQETPSMFSELSTQDSEDQDQWTASFIQLAQIVADQAVHYKSLCHSDGLLSEASHCSSRRLAIDPLAEAVANIFPGSKLSSLLECASFKDDQSQPSKSSQSRNSQTSKEAHSKKAIFDSPDTSEISSFSLPVPDFRVKRGDTTMDISSTALEFWKELGLGPLHGSKDVTAFCICPNNPMFRRGAENFIDAIGQTYLSLRLGSHSSGHPALKKYSGGLVAFSSFTDAQETLDGLEDVCEVLGKSLSALAALEKTIVIYMTDPTNGKSSGRRLCELFQKTFEAYASAVRMANNPCDLVMQLVPLNWIGSPYRIAILSLRQCTRLANIIYDRCPLADSAYSAYSSVSLFELVKPLPKTVNFRLNSTQLSSPTKDAKLFYLGYSWNEQFCWLSAAFVDCIGSQQWSASYCLGQFSSRWSSFEAVAQEIWEVLEEAVHVSQDDCRVIVTKLEPLHSIEREIWKSLAVRSDVGISFVIIDESLPICLVRKNPQIISTDINYESLTMPDTPDIACAEQSGLKFLEEHDSNTRLINSSAQKWGLISNCLLTASHGLTIKNEIASGYIVGADNSLIGIYLVESTKNCDFKSILSSLYNLSVLTQARGIEEALPWHIAVAKLAHAGVEAAMGDTGIT